MNLELEFPITVPHFFRKGGLGAVVKLLPCDQEVKGSSRVNSLLQMQEKVVYYSHVWDSSSSKKFGGAGH